MIRRLLITGVPGWLTTALLESLQEDPPEGLEEVRCLALAPLALAPRPGTTVGLRVFVGGLHDARVLDEAAQGCDAVLHAAGVLHVRRTRDWYDTNTNGTSNLLRAAAAGGVRRFVLISSNAAAGRSEHGALLTEDTPAKPLSHYGRSKLLAEQLVLSAPLEGVVLRPCMFYGPPVPARHVEIYRRILDGRMPMVGHGHYARSVTHIANLVQGCRLALGHPRAAGQVYYIADEPVYTTRAIVEAMADALGCRTRYLRIPGVAAPLSFAADRLLASVGLYWQTLHLVGEADWHVGVSIAKAQRELGYAPRVTLPDGMRQAVEWCRAEGLLPKKLP